MPTFLFRKLVRDKFREIYGESGQKITTRPLTTSEFKEEIRMKIIEEAQELPIEEAKNETVINEIADIQQALDDLKHVYGVSDDEVQRSMEAKYQQKGGFREGLFVETIELRDNDKWVAYYRAAPEKYKEVQDNG